MKKKFFIGLFIAAVIGLSVFAYAALAKKNDYRPQQNLQSPIEIPDTGIVKYSEITDNEKPVVAMFYVDWCGYCRRFMPEYGKLAKKLGDKYTFSVVNCDEAENAELTREYNIMSFPSLFVIDNKLVHSFSLNMAGTVEPEIMQEELEEYINFRNRILSQISASNKQH